MLDDIEMMEEESSTGCSSSSTTMEKQPSNKKRKYEPSVSEATSSILQEAEYHPQVEKEPHFFTIYPKCCFVNEQVTVTAKVYPFHRNHISVYLLVDSKQIEPQSVSEDSDGYINCDFLMPKSQNACCQTLAYQYKLAEYPNLEVTLKGVTFTYKDTMQELSVAVGASTPSFFNPEIILGIAFVPTSTQDSSNSSTVGFSCKSSALELSDEIKQLPELFVAKYHIPIKEYNFKELILEATTKDITALRYVPQILRDNKEFILQIVKKDARAMEFVSTRLQNELDVCYAAANAEIKSGNLLKYFSDEIKDTQKELMSQVLRNMYPLAPKWDSTCTIPEMFETVINYEPYALLFASSTLANDKEFIFKAVKANGLCLQYAKQQFKDNIEIVAEAISQNQTAQYYAGPLIQQLIKAVNK